MLHTEGVKLLGHGHSTVLLTLMPWAPNNGWEDRPRRIISSKARLHHSRTIVAHQGRHFSIVSH